MKQSFTTAWHGGVAFETQLGSHTIRTEAPPKHGGSGTAPSPKPLMIAALAG